MKKLCFVCHGNICRSPMAEFIMKALVRQADREADFYIVSAATHTDNIRRDGSGSPIYPQALDQLQTHGVPVGDKRAVLLQKADYGAFDCFIGMDEENMIYMRRIFGGDPDDKLRKLLSFAGSERDVSDPWYTGNFDLAYADIHAGCEALLRQLS